MEPCRTTQHCTVHGFCNRCSPELTAKARNVLATLREELTEPQVTRAYHALARILLDRETERCTHTRAMHDKHHPFHHAAPGCPWCQEEAEKHHDRPRR